jgi:hypothetical protein
MSSLKYCFYFILLNAICIISANSIAFAAAADTTKPILIQTDKRSDLQKFLGVEAQDQQKDRGIFLPGGDSTHILRFTAAQDSAYLKAMKMKIPNYARFIFELSSDPVTNYDIDRYERGQWAIMTKNMDLPASYFAPKRTDIAAYQFNISASQYVPFVNTTHPGAFQMPLSTIGQFFGLVEDVSPTIKYKVDSQSDVEVVVYSIQAIVVQTMYQGSQRAGEYSLTWNLRNEKGKLMPPGDYVIEARIGKYRIVRKRVLIA